MHHAEGDSFGAAVRYALLAEQGCASAELNLAWLMHRGLAYRGADRHRLALRLWERASFRGQTEGRLMAAHVLLDGHKYGLEGGEPAVLSSLAGCGGGGRLHDGWLAVCACRPPLSVSHPRLRTLFLSEPAK